MEFNYKNVFEDILNNELIYTVVIAVILFAIVITVCLGCYFHFRKIKKNNSAKYNSDKNKKKRRQGIFAVCLLSAVCILFSVLYIYDFVKIKSEIDKDMSDEAYIVYKGNFYVSNDNHRLKYGFDKWYSVDIGGDYLNLYMGDFFDLVNLDEGNYDGIIVYGKNSHIIVNITY